MHNRILTLKGNQKARTPSDSGPFTSHRAGPNLQSSHCTRHSEKLWPVESNIVRRVLHVSSHIHQATRDNRTRNCSAKSQLHQSIKYTQSYVSLKHCKNVHQVCINMLHRQPWLLYNDVLCKDCAVYLLDLTRTCKRRLQRKVYLMRGRSASSKKGTLKSATEITESLAELHN